VRFQLSLKNITDLFLLIY